MKKTSHSLDFRKNVMIRDFTQTLYSNFRSELKIGFSYKHTGEASVNKITGVAGVMPFAGAHMNKSMNYLL